jgi:hypothetical protein
MCAKKLITPSRCDNASEESTSSPVRGNTIRSRYRVLRDAMGRPIPRSVDRNCAGRKALSGLKGSSSDKHIISVVAEQLLSSEGNTGWMSSSGTTGVQDLGMYRKKLLGLGRSLKGRTRKIRFDGQELKLKSKTTPLREFRCLHSSWEVR